MGKSKGKSSEDSSSTGNKTKKSKRVARSRSASPASASKKTARGRTQSAGKATKRVRFADQGSPSQETTLHDSDQIQNTDQGANINENARHRPGPGSRPRPDSASPLSVSDNSTSGMDTTGSSTTQEPPPSPVESTVPVDIPDDPTWDQTAEIDGVTYKFTARGVQVKTREGVWVQLQPRANPAPETTDPVPSMSQAPQPIPVTTTSGPGTSQIPNQWSTFNARDASAVLSTAANAVNFNQRADSFVREANALIAQLQAKVQAAAASPTPQGICAQPSPGQGAPTLEITRMSFLVRRLFTHVLPTLREKVVQNQFIELHTLLFDRQKAIDKSDTVICVKDHLLQTKPAQPYGPIQDWAEWQRAFRIYEAIFLEFRPDQADQLKAYQSHIQELALGFKWPAVNNYDRLFRHGLAEGLYTSWVEIDPLLYNGHFNASSALPQYKKEAAQKPSTSTPICCLYNKDKCKWGAKCTWSHRCDNCNILGHPSTRCKVGKTQSSTSVISTTSSTPQSNWIFQVRRPMNATFRHLSTHRFWVSYCVIILKALSCVIWHRVLHMDLEWDSRVL